MKWLKINCFLCDDSGSPIPGSRKLFQVHGSFTLRMFLDQALPAMKFECDRIHTIQHVHNDDFSTFLSIWIQQGWRNALFTRYFQLTEMLLSQRLSETTFSTSAEDGALNMLFEHKITKKNHMGHKWPRENEWGCRACTFLNRNYDCHKCEMCETERNENISISDVLEPGSRRESLVYKIPFAAIDTGSAKTGHGNIDVPLAPQINLKPTLLDRYSHCDSLPLAVDERSTKQPSHKYGSMEIHKAETEATNVDDKTTKFTATLQKSDKTYGDYTDASLMSHRIHPQSDVNSSVRGKDKDIGNGKMVISLALLSGCRKDVCFQYIASVVDNTTSNDQGRLLPICDLKILAISLRNAMSEKVEKKLQEFSEEDREVVGELCEKVTHRFLYGEKNVVYNDCWRAIMLVTGATVFGGAVVSASIDNTASVLYDTTLAPPSKTFLKECLVKIIHHLLSQENVDLGSEEASQIKECLLCFVYIAIHEILHGQFRFLQLYAKILCPRHNLYESLHGKISKCKLNRPTKNWSKNHLTCIKNDSYISVPDNTKVDIGSRHIIDACLNISMNRGVYNAISRLLCEQEHKAWLGLQHYNSLLKIIFYSSECLSREYVIAVCETVISNLECVGIDTILHEASILSGESKNVLTQLLQTLMHLTYWHCKANADISRRWLAGIVFKSFLSNNLQQRLFSIDALLEWCKFVACSNVSKRYAQNLYSSDKTSEGCDNSVDTKSLCELSNCIEWIYDKEIVKKIFERKRLRVEIVNRATKLVLFFVNYCPGATTIENATTRFFSTRDLDLIWNSCIGRNSSIVNSVVTFIVTLTKDLPDEILLPVFSRWAANVDKFQSELMVLMITFASDAKNYTHTLFSVALVNYAVKIIWNLIVLSENKNKEIMILATMLNRLMHSDYNNAQEHKIFVYKECLSKLLVNRNSSYAIFLRILEDNVYGRYDASKVASLKMFDNIEINRIDELDNICTKLQIDGAEDFWPSKMTSRNSILGVLIHVLRTKFVPKPTDDKLDHVSGETKGKDSYNQILRCLMFLDKVSRCYEYSRKLNEVDIKDLWSSLRTTAEGREAFYVWLQTTNYDASRQPNCLFQHGTQKFIFEYILCESSNISTLSESGYSCFYNYFTQLNQEEKRMNMLLNSIQHVHGRAKDLSGYQYILEIIVNGTRNVYESAISLYVKLFYSLNSDQRVNERQYLLRNMMDCMERNKTVSEFSAGAQAIERSILLLKRMVEEDSRLYIYNSAASFSSQYDANKKIQSQRSRHFLRPHGKLTRGKNITLRIAYSRSNLDRSESSNAVLHLDDITAGAHSIFVIKTHTNAFLMDLRKQIASTIWGVDFSNDAPHKSKHNNVGSLNDYKKLKLMLRGKSLAGANVFLDDPAVMLRTGDELHVSLTLLDQENIKPFSDLKYPGSRVDVLGEPKQSRKTLSADVTNDSSVTPNDLIAKTAAIIEENTSDEVCLAEIIQKQDSLYKFIFRMLADEKISQTWKQNLWDSLLAFPSWEAIMSQFKVPSSLEWGTLRVNMGDTLMTYVLIGVRSMLLPASFERLPDSKHWRKDFIVSGGFEFLLSIFDKHTQSYELRFTKRSLVDTLHCLKYLVLGSLKALPADGLMELAGEGRDTPKMADITGNAALSPPRIGKLLDSDASISGDTFDRDTAERVLKSLDAEALLSNLLDIINYYDDNDTESIMAMDALHAIEEIVRSMPSKVLQFSKIIIDKNLAKVAVSNFSSLIRTASVAVIKSLWQCIFVFYDTSKQNSNKLSNDFPHVFNAANKANTLLTRNIIETIDGIDWSGSKHFYELSLAIEFHIKNIETAFDNDDDDTEFLAPTHSINGTHRSNSVHSNAGNQWEPVLEALLYKLADTKINSILKLEQIKRHGSQCGIANGSLRHWHNVQIIVNKSIEGVLIALVSLGQAYGVSDGKSEVDASPKQKLSKRLLKFIVHKGIFYSHTTGKEEHQRCLFDSKSTRRLALQLLSKNIDVHDDIRDDLFDKLQILYDINSDFVSDVNNWKYDPSNASRPSHGYCGLTNQGATCYINSLVQQLFMCGKIRDGILKSKNNGDERGKDTKILIELKRLFAFLQRSEAKSYNTTKFVDACRSLDLTNDVLSQNDTAEFCDKLVDRLEDALSDTWSIFTGSILHEMDFLGVPFRSEKSQKFACLQLPIIGGADSSLKESLAAFVKPEKMEGENQVECHEAANVKFDALRRDWLAELPELLIVHLKRWEFDYQTFLMKKNNNFCKFPMELDVAEYTHSGSHAKQRGSTMYILSGILIHRGPAGGGHYYSIIKDRETGQWYKFNDESVMKFNIDDISKESFGKDDGDQSAYMLFYDFQSTVCNKMPSLPVVDRNPMDEDAMIVDRKLEKEITAFNAAFIQKQILFDQTLLKFVYDDMIQSNYSIRQYKLIIQVFFGVVIRSYHVSLMKPYLEHLREKVRKTFELSTWTMVEYFCPHNIEAEPCVLKHLLLCSDNQKRQALSQFVVTTMVGIQSHGVLKRGSKLAEDVKQCMHHLVEMMWEAAKHWRHCQSYFKMLGLLLKLSTCYEILMCTTDIVPRLVHYFLGIDSSNHKYPKLPSWHNVEKAWDYATEAPDRTLSLKVLVQIFENEDIRSRSSEVGNGLMKQINITKENKTCGIDFYKYVTSMFDKNTKEYKLVQRIASTEGINMESLGEKLILEKIINRDDGSIRIGCEKMYCTNMYAVATVFVTDFKVPFDSTVETVKICMTNFARRPLDVGANDFFLLVLEEQDLEKDDVVFDDGISINIAKNFRKRKNRPITTRKFVPGNAVTAMRFDANSGEGGEFETGFIKAAYPDTDTYDVCFEDGSTSEGLLSDFISLLEEPYKKQFKSFKIIQKVALKEIEVRRTDIQTVTGLHCKVTKGQYLGIANYSGQKLWFSWEDKWKKTDAMHFNSYFTCTESISKNVGSTLFSLRPSSCRAQYSFSLVQVGET